MSTVPELLRDKGRKVSLEPRLDAATDTKTHTRKLRNVSRVTDGFTLQLTKRYYGEMVVYGYHPSPREAETQSGGLRPAPSMQVLFSYLV